jgi:hypothetical protein
MSNSLTTLYANLSAITAWTNRVIPIFQMVFGTFGNVWNIIIFTRPALRTNPCSMYFLVGSIYNIVFMYVGIFTRYFAEAWNLDISLTNVVICKLRNFLIYSSFAIVSWLIALTSIDRFLSSSKSVRLRQLSSLPIARKNIIFTITIVCLLYSESLICFVIAPSYGVKSCYIASPICSTIFYASDPFISSVIPIILQSIFGILTIVNVRSMHNRVIPVADNARNERLRSNDRKLIRMHLFQVLITILLLAPYVVLSLYYGIAVAILNQELSMYDQFLFLFIFNFARFLGFTNPVIGFYIYTLTGPKFRAEFKRCNQYGLQITLTATGLMRYLPMRVEQALRGENQINITSQPTRRTGKRK